MPATIDTATLARRLADAEVQLVEVLPEKEFGEERLPGAINVPLKDMTPERVHRDLDARRPVIVYCYDDQ